MIKRFLQHRGQPKGCPLCLYIQVGISYTLKHEKFVMATVGRGSTGQDVSKGNNIVVATGMVSHSVL